jgi:hypothetical protein
LVLPWSSAQYQDSALGRDIKIVGFRNILQRFLGQCHLILRCFLCQHGGPSLQSKDILHPGILARRLFFRLGVVLREAATEALLFGEMVGIVQGRQVRNPFFSLFATV